MIDDGGHPVLTAMQGAIVYLIGYPGVGKLTVAKALCERTGARLVDNHVANNPIFNIIAADGVTPIPEAAWDRIKAIRDVLFDTILHVAPRDFSFVLTNVLHDDKGDRALFDQVAELAEQRGSLFVPVMLRCERGENLQRVVAPGRAEYHKDVRPAMLEKLLAECPLLQVVHPHRLELDTTHLSPSESAAAVIDHINRIDCARS